MKYLDPVSFVSEKPDIPVVDVRSPKEYEKGHITGAFNIPLFSDLERVEIGTLYKQKGKIPAIQRGLEFIGPKMRKISEEAMEISQKDHLKVYCWRGGMRSEKMSWLFELVGIKCNILKGGFKAYRNQLLKDFSELPELIVLQGPTGSGKTDVLAELSKLGEQILDLEGLARHRGSAFGHIGMGEQPTSLQFQNNLHHELMQLDRSKRIWIESESMSIGKVYLPETLWERINQGPVIELALPMNIRIQRLVDEYGRFGTEILISSTKKISKKFGPKNVGAVLDSLKNGDLSHAAGLLLSYYDRSYIFSQKKYKMNKPLLVESKTGDPLSNAKKLLKEVDKIDF